MITLKSEAKIFQLCGNSSVENLLEFLSTKMSMNYLHSNDTFTAASASNFTTKSDNSSRLDNLENMMEKLLSGMTNKNVQTKVDCKICHKSGHSEDKCFKQKTFFKCRQKGHIARYCRNETQNREHTSAFKCGQR